MKINNNPTFSGGYRILNAAPPAEIVSAIKTSKPIANFLNSSKEDLLIKIKSRVITGKGRYTRGLDDGDAEYNVIFSLSANKDSKYAKFFDFFRRHVPLSRRNYDETQTIARLKDFEHMQKRVFSLLV